MEVDDKIWAHDSTPIYQYTYLGEQISGENATDWWAHQAKKESSEEKHLRIPHMIVLFLLKPYNLPPRTADRNGNGSTGNFCQIICPVSRAKACKSTCLPDASPQVSAANRPSFRASYPQMWLTGHPGRRNQRRGVRRTYFNDPSLWVQR